MNNHDVFFWELVYLTAECNKRIEWCRGTEQQAHLHCQRRQDDDDLVLDEMYRYELDDPRVNTGVKGLMVRAQNFRDFLQDIYND